MKTNSCREGNLCPCIIQDKFSFRNIFIIIFSLLATAFSSVIYAQGKTVSGVVTDGTGAPMQGVSVSLKGSTLGVVTGINGKYSIFVRGDKAVLMFSHVGTSPRELAVGSNSKLDVSLGKAAGITQDVVVVGYGTQKKLTVTGSISSVKGEQIAEIPVSNISNSIAGRVSGVSMRPNGGQPGSDGAEIFIRGIGTLGNRQPLIVIDGIVRRNITQLDPNTIESITVLKDAAAVAPYGLGGANGVILITTKKAKEGDPTLTLNCYYGSQTPTYYPKLLGPQDYMRLKNEAYLNEKPGGANLPFAKEFVENYPSLNATDPDKYPISDAKEIVNMHAPMQDYNLQLIGGSDKIKYFTGFGYYQQNAMFDPIRYARYNYYLNLAAHATKTTTVSVSLLGSIENNESVDPEVSAVNLFRSSFKYIPIQSIYYSNGLWGEFAGNSPIGVLKAGYARSVNNTLLTSIAIEQTLPFIQGLSAKVTFSYDPNQRTGKNWHTPFYYYSQDISATPYTYSRQISTAEGNATVYTWLNQSYSKNQIFTYQGFLNYHNTAGKNDFTGLFVAEARNNTFETFSARRNNFPINIDELSAGSSNRNDFDNSGNSSTGSQVGYVYRLGYVYNSRYLFEASGRYDGHYYFAPGERWGYFPAFSAGWLLSQETFFRKNLPFFESFKLRGSWGKTGNLTGTGFQYLNIYNLEGDAYAFGSGNMVQGSFNPREANPDITWEIAAKTDVGFESVLLKGLLTVEADYFHERRSHMLLPPTVTVPVEYGLALSDENEGIMQTNGVEVSVGITRRLKDGVRLVVNGNFSYAANEMIQIFETPATRDNPNRSRTGRAFGTPFGYHSLGLFNMSDDKNGDGIINAADGYNVIQFGDLHPGDIKYQDIGGIDGKPDGKIDSYDETVIGRSVYPAITYGITSTVSVGGFDLNLFFQGSAQSGLDIRQFQTIPFNNNNSNSSYEYYNNHWTPATPNARYPRATQAPYTNNTQASDFWMANTGFIRLKNASLGYSLPKNVTQILKIKAVRFYVSGENIMTISKMKFMDPEVGYSDRETAYPNQKVYVAGVDITF